MILYFITLTNALGSTLKSHKTVLMHEDNLGDGEPAPFADDVQPLSDFPDGPLYFLNKGEGLTWEDARKFC